MKKDLWVLFVMMFFTLISNVTAQEFKIETLAFYNLENLFDTVDDSLTQDELSPIMELKIDREQVYLDKLQKLSSVIVGIGQPTSKEPPAVIGVAEVENRKVLEDLTQTALLKPHHYQIIHFDSQDPRGIDVALLYRPDCFSPVQFESYLPPIYANQFFVKTRDVLWVYGYLNEQPIHFLVNHWSSRRGGVEKSESLRNQASKFVQDKVNQLYVDYPEEGVVVMGDFNDNPSDVSMVSLATKAQLKNPFDEIFKNGIGTLCHQYKNYLFDQILFSNHIAKPNNKHWFFYKANIYREPFLLESNGFYAGCPKRSFFDEGYHFGYSDHLPVYIYLIKPVKESE